MTLLRSRVLALLALLLGCSCTLHSTATDWSGLVGANGYPIFVKSSTNIGINLGVVIPVLGHTTMISMVGEVAEEAVTMDRGAWKRLSTYQTEDISVGWGQCFLRH